MRNFWDECWANQSVFNDFTTSNEGFFSGHGRFTLRIFTKKWLGILRQTESLTKQSWL